MLLLNIRALTNKVDDLEAVFKLNDVDVAVITETPLAAHHRLSYSIIWAMDYFLQLEARPWCFNNTDEGWHFLWNLHIPRSKIISQRKGPNVRHQTSPGWPPKSSHWFLKGRKPSIWATTPGGSTAIQFPEPSEPPNTSTLLRSYQGPTPVVTLVYGTGLWNSSVQSAPRTGTFT